MSFFAQLASPFWKQLEGYGLDPAAVFKRAGINPEVIFDPGARIPYKSLDGLVQLSVELSGDACFGLRHQQYFLPAHLGALGFAWLASTSIRTAFQRMSRYARVINDELSVTLDDDGSNLIVTFKANSPSANEPVREDMQLALATRCCRVIAGDQFCPALVRFMHPKPADTSYHYELFRCPIEFDSPATSMLISRKAADQPLTGSNEELARLNEHIVVKYLAHTEKKDIVNRVKAAIIDHLASGRVSETLVAGTVHMTARNLHRKLARENTSFKLLLNQVRQELAQQYIRDRSMTLTEITFMLGFSEVSSFSRAYKNWTGEPPSAVRKAGASTTA